MKLLLDTHAWIWAVEDPARLGRKTRAALRNLAHERFVCAASVLEMARLVWSGDISLQIPLDEWIARSLQDLRAEALPISTEIAVEAYALPEPFHRDPADRLIVACARIHELTVVTADQRIIDWDHVAVLDARK